MTNIDQDLNLRYVLTEAKSLEALRVRPPALQISTENSQLYIETSLMLLCVVLETTLLVFPTQHALATDSSYHVSNFN